MDGPQAHNVSTHQNSRSRAILVAFAGSLSGLTYQRVMSRIAARWTTADGAGISVADALASLAESERGKTV